MKDFVSDDKTCMFTFSLMNKLFVRFVKSRKLVFDDQINTIQTCRIINHTWRHCTIKCQTSVKDVILFFSMLFSGVTFCLSVMAASNIHEAGFSVSRLCIRISPIKHHTFYYHTFYWIKTDTSPLKLFILRHIIVNKMGIHDQLFWI